MEQVLEQPDLKRPDLSSKSWSYEGIDASKKDELTKKVNESLAPRLSKLPGFDS